MTDEEQQQTEPTEEEPQVYTVKKDVNGWRFDRRAFLAVAGAAAATAAVGTAGCGSPPESIQESTAVTGGTVTATPSSTPPPSDTPAPTSTPKLAEAPAAIETPSVAHTPDPTVPVAQLVEDITIQDGTVMLPGQSFTKTWRFRNVGAVPWGPGVKLVFVEGQQEGFESKKMDGPDAVDVPNVAPGESVDVSVDLKAPEELGRHRSYWRLQLGSGQRLENVLYIELFVAGMGEVLPGEEGATVQGPDGESRWLPCGEPVPSGWICICNCVAVPFPGEEGEVPPGEEGATILGPNGESRWLPCGAPIPPGWICTCNCVSVPQPCACVGHAICSCDAVHYWHPN